jgi:hypothetical protein
MYKLELFTWVRLPYIWQMRKRANAPNIVNGNCLQQVKGPWHRLSRVHRDILIFTSSAFKTWVLHVNTFYSWILLYISPVTAVNISILSVLYITHLLQLYLDTHVSLCTNLLVSRIWGRFLFTV